MPENSLKQLKDFFSTSDKPVTPSEMAEFWKSCSDEEKAYYKAQTLV